jgi:hypothetical protein
MSDNGRRDPLTPRQTSQVSLSGGSSACISRAPNSSATGSDSQRFPITAQSRAAPAGYLAGRFVGQKDLDSDSVARHHTEPLLAWPNHVHRLLSRCSASPASMRDTVLGGDGVATAGPRRSPFSVLELWADQVRAAGGPLLWVGLRGFGRPPLAHFERQPRTPALPLPGVRQSRDASGLRRARGAVDPGAAEMPSASALA